MTVSENELEMLELFLDGELSADEVASMSARFESEPALVMALARLTAERDARRAIWSSIEPSEAAADRLVKSIKADVQSHRAREQVWIDRSRLFRRSGMVAACLMLAFLAGWLGRGNVTVNSPSPLSPTIVSAPGNSFVEPPPGQMVFDPRAVESLHVPKLVAPNESRAPEAYVVRLTDDNTGQVVGMQKFATLEEAQRFADNFGRLHQVNRERRDQGNRETVAPRENIKLVSKEEF